VNLIVGMERLPSARARWWERSFVVSGLAVSFLLWLLYVHHAPPDFAGRWMFLPALNALLNGLCAIALCVGFLFHQTSQQKRASHEHAAWPSRSPPPFSSATS